MRNKKRPDELFAEILKNDSVSPPKPSTTVPTPKSKERYRQDGDATNRQIVMDALGDRYEIESTIARGPFGSVYKVRDTELNRIIAVKNARLDMAASETQDSIKKRFLREASVASLLSHPGIVAIHDIISTPHASIVLMEYVEGVSLKSILEKKKRLSLEQTTRILKQVAAALDHAHQQKVIHRDIKPSNIMVTFDNDVRVMDFGTAKIESGNTVGGTILGTPDYMSPEQAKAETVDSRSDLFSLGCVLFECLVGERPFKSESVTGVLLRIVSEDPPPPIPWRELGHPSALEQVMTKALAKNPDARYQTGAALAEAFDQLLLGEDEEASVETGKEPEPESTESDDPVELNTEPELEANKDDESVDIIVEPELAATRGDESVEINIEPELGFTQGDEQIEITMDQEFGFTQGDQVVPPPRSPQDASRADVSYLDALEDLERPLTMTVDSSNVLNDMKLEPNETFIISGIDGKATARYILDLSPLPKEETAKSLVTLIEKGLIKFRDSTEAIPVENRRVKNTVQRDESPEARQAPLPEPETAPTPATEVQTPLDEDDQTESQLDHQQANDLYARAEKAYTGGDFWEAIQLCRYAVEASPKDGRFHYLLGLALSENANWKSDAEESLKTALRIDSQNREYVNALADFFQKHGRMEEAKQMYDRAKTIQ
jgi:serine/threonine protein kinase